MVLISQMHIFHVCVCCKATKKSSAKQVTFIFFFSKLINALYTNNHEIVFMHVYIYIYINIHNIGIRLEHTKTATFLHK